MMAPCPYCQSPVELASSAKVYGGRDFGMAYICTRWPACDAYVGVHKGTDKPLGRLANAELREWKKKAHAAFDPLWMKKLEKRRQERGPEYKKAFARGSGYRWLSEQLGIDQKDCHIGMFDVETCKRVVEVCEAKRWMETKYFGEAWTPTNEELIGAVNRTAEKIKKGEIG
jgi:hypothetical protein